MSIKKIKKKHYFFHRIVIFLNLYASRANICHLINIYSHTVTASEQAIYSRSVYVDSDIKRNCKFFLTKFAVSGFSGGLIIVYEHRKNEKKNKVNKTNCDEIWKFHCL